MHDYTIAELEKWDRKIRRIAEQEGLDPFPQEFEICDSHEMLGYEAYAGMPSHYPHWSFGKTFERMRTLYRHGVAGLPYEMVINANPALAYLKRDNTLLLQILTIAHVYAHNDFFKNNVNFAHTRPEYTIEKFKAHADRIRAYIEDPSIGLERVESILDAAHALQYQCRRAKRIPPASRQEQERRAVERAMPPKDPFSTLHPRREYHPPDLTRVPLEPEEDLLLFIRDQNPYLEPWERDLLTIVRERADYFLPQIETKIMNEGWASYWHHRILHRLELPPALHIEFIKRHNQVIRPVRGGLNPYHLGFKIFEDIFRRWEEPSAEEREEYGRPGGEGLARIFQVREVDRDASFLRQYLTEELMRELDLFQHEKKGKDRVITKVSSPDGWKAVKETLLKNVGLGSIPVIKIVEVKSRGDQEMILEHEYDGRELDRRYADRTLGYVQRLWGKKVSLLTRFGGVPCKITCAGDGTKPTLTRL